MIKTIDRNKIRQHKHARIRNHIRGTQEIPRLCVYRSNTNMYAQIINDDKHETLAAASSLDKDLKGSLKNGGNIEAAKMVGKKIAEQAKAKNITKVVFDRSGYLYHGRVAALADAAREGGLEF